MKNVSDKLKNIIEKGGLFYAYAKVLFADGTEITLDSEDRNPAVMIYRWVPLCPKLSHCPYSMRTEDFRIMIFFIHKSHYTQKQTWKMVHRKE